MTAETPPRRITGEPPGWEGTRAQHDRLYGAPATPARPRLTPHQRDVLRDLTVTSARNVRAGQDGWVPLRWIGSRGALDHLVDKGHAERRMTYGPRGGERPEYRPVPSTSSTPAPGEAGAHRTHTTPEVAP